MTNYEMRMRCEVAQRSPCRDCGENKWFDLQDSWVCTKCAKTHGKSGDGDGDYRPRYLSKEALEGYRRSEYFKRYLKPWAGLSIGLSQCSKPSITISRHWPHLLCWDWSIWISRVTPGYRKFFNFTRHHQGWSIQLLWLVSISYNWQDYGWMLNEWWKQ